MKFISEQAFFEFPADVAVCPACGGTLVAGFDEYEAETGQVIETSFYVFCENVPDIKTEYDEWEKWFVCHWPTIYKDWIRLNHRLHEWFMANYRVHTSTQDVAELVAESENTGEFCLESLWESIVKSAIKRLDHLHLYVCLAFALIRNGRLLVTGKQDSDQQPHQ